MQPVEINPKRLEAPLYEALTAHARLRAHPFHVPGHKQRADSLGGDAAGYYAPLLDLDVTELSDTDDLHHPQGPLAEAQELAAECFGAEETRFLVGGSTSGNLAAILGLCAPGELMIVQRNVHKSIIHGLMLAGARAVLLPAYTDALSGLATGPDAASLAAALERYPEAKAVFLSTPNYYGMSPDLPALVRLAHDRGVPVLVDEAHGAHYGLHPAFPRSALQAGADLVIQSTHKLLSAMTMGGMLHMQGTRFDREPVRQALRMVQSSSPSFPILASLDLARRQIDREGPDVFRSALEAAKRAVAGLGELPGRPFGALGSAAGNGKAGTGLDSELGSGPESQPNPGAAIPSSLTYDPLKLALYDRTGRWSGFELRDELLKRGCVAEMADSRYVLLVFGTGSMPGDGDALLAALQVMVAGGTANAVNDRLEIQESLPLPEPVRFSRSLGPSRAMPLEESAGRVAAEWVIPYPPGIPVLYPGERITREAIAELVRWRSNGAQIQGAADPGLHSIRVVEESN